MTKNVASSYLQTLKVSFWCFQSEQEKHYQSIIYKLYVYLLRRNCNLKSFRNLLNFLIEKIVVISIDFNIWMHLITLRFQ